MMPQSVEGLMFTSLQIRSMQEALRRACAALAFAFPAGAVDDRTKTRLARHILASTAGGEGDPARLSAIALRALPPLGSVGAAPAARPARARSAVPAH
jgi:hypothetical protein